MIDSPDALLALVLRDFAGTPVATADIRLIDFDPRTALEPVDGVAQLVVETASALQDFVIDETNRPWPELTSGGESTVLEPGLARDGSPCWAARGAPVCAIGELAARL